MPQARYHIWPALAAPLIMIALVAVPLSGLAPYFAKTLEADLSPQLWSALTFSLNQAGLSSFLSLAGGLMVARALHRRPRFLGRNLLLGLMGLAFVFPPILTALGMIAVHGRAGWISELAQLLGLMRLDYLYGWFGILAAHIFFNMAFAARVFLHAFANIPGEHWRVATALGLGAVRMFRHAEWPAIRGAVMPLAALIFLLCFTSFAIVLFLGGHPRFATLEVVIFQALLGDGDLVRASQASIIQLSISLSFAVIMIVLPRLPAIEGGVRPSVRIASSRLALWIDAGWILFAFLLLLPPVLAIGLSGLINLRFILDPGLWLALLNSIRVGVPATMVALSLAVALALARSRLLLGGHDWLAGLVQATPLLLPGVPAIVYGAGLFLLARKVGFPEWSSWLALTLANSIMITPFLCTIIANEIHQSLKRDARLCAHLGLTGWVRFRRINWPQWRPALLYGVIVGFCLSLGDMGAVVFFGYQGFETLPLAIFRAQGAYRTDQAMAGALILILVSGGLFYLAERLRRG
ncbi:MAG: ABC transporter permease subunit [Pseudomonadota bacterium]